MLIFNFWGRMSAKNFFLLQFFISLGKPKFDITSFFLGHLILGESCFYSQCTGLLYKVRCMKFGNRKIVSDLLSNFFEKVMDILLERVCSIISRDNVKQALSDSLGSCLDGHMLGHAILKKDVIIFMFRFASQSLKLKNRASQKHSALTRFTVPYKKPAKSGVF